MDDWQPEGCSYLLGRAPGHIGDRIAIVLITSAPAWLQPGSGSLLFTRCRSVGWVYGQPGVYNYLTSQALALEGFWGYFSIPDRFPVPATSTERNTGGKIIV